MTTLFCQKCCKETEHLRIHVARRTAGVCRASIYRWIASGTVHSRTGPGGLTLICRNSLINPQVPPVF